MQRNPSTSAVSRCCRWCCRWRRGTPPAREQRQEMSAPLRTPPQSLDSVRVEELAVEKPQLNALDVGPPSSNLTERISAILRCPSRSRSSTADQVTVSPNDFEQAFNSPESFVSVNSSLSEPEEIPDVREAAIASRLLAPQVAKGSPLRRAVSPPLPAQEAVVDPLTLDLQAEPALADYVEAESDQVMRSYTNHYGDWTSELESLQSIQRDLMAGLIERLAYEDWDVNSSTRELSIYRRMAPGGTPGYERSIPMFRVERTMRNGAPRDVFEILIDGERQPTWNSYCAFGKDHGTEHGATLLQSSFKGLGPVSAREALEFRAASRDAQAETLWIAYSSVGTAELGVPVTEKHQRSYTMFSGYLLRPGSEPDTTSLTFISHVDAGGGLPDWITNKAGPKGATDVTRALQVALDRKRKS